jgi:hypothetical protein
MLVFAAAAYRGGEQLLGANEAYSKSPSGAAASSAVAAGAARRRR